MLDRASEINDLSQAVFTAIGGVLAICGIRYLHILRKKKAEATFSFWSQLSIRLLQLRAHLNQDKAIINNLFSPDCIKRWGTEGAPTTSERIIEFQTIVKETTEFLKNATDQVPAYAGWIDDYYTIMCFLDDVMFYDILNSEKHYKFASGDISKRNRECDRIINSLDNLISGIEKNQRRVEKELNKRSK